MKRFLILATALCSIQTAYCQKQLWGLPPEEVMKSALAKGGKLERQETKGPVLTLQYAEKPGLTVTYVFRKEALEEVINRYDPRLITVDPPVGEKTTTPTGNAWISVANNTFITRRYKGSYIEDVIAPNED